MKEIRLTRGYVALVDDADYDAVMQWKWQARRTRGNVVYAQRVQRLVPGAGASGPRRSIQMHRFIMGEPSGVRIDHVNGNGLDNRRENLRPATDAENQWNTGVRRKRAGLSRFKGVRFFKHGHRRKWSARIFANGVEHSLGYHLTQEEAARAYDEAAIKLHGEFARLNFPAVQG